MKSFAIRFCIFLYNNFSWLRLESLKKVHYLHYFVLRGHKSCICDANFAITKTISKLNIQVGFFSINTDSFRKQKNFICVSLNQNCKAQRLKKLQKTIHECTGCPKIIVILSGFEFLTFMHLYISILNILTSQMIFGILKLKKSQKSKKICKF